MSLLPTGEMWGDDEHFTPSAGESEPLPAVIELCVLWGCIMACNTRVMSLLNPQVSVSEHSSPPAAEKVFVNLFYLFIVAAIQF